MSKTHLPPVSGGWAHSRCANGTRRSVIVTSEPTCRVCRSLWEREQAMRFLAGNRDAINSATGPLCPPGLGEQVVAYQRGRRAGLLAAAAEARREVANWTAELSAEDPAVAACREIALWCEAEAAK